MTDTPQTLTYSRNAKLSFIIAACTPFFLIAAGMLYLAIITIIVGDISTATYVLIALSALIVFVIVGVLRGAIVPALVVTRDEIRTQRLLRTLRIPITEGTRFGTFASERVIGRNRGNSNRMRREGRKVQTIALWVWDEAGKPVEVVTVFDDHGRIYQFLNQVTEMTGHQVEELKRDTSRPLSKTPDMSHWA